MPRCLILPMGGHRDGGKHCSPWGIQQQYMGLGVCPEETGDSDMSKSFRIATLLCSGKPVWKVRCGSILCTVPDPRCSLLTSILSTPASRRNPLRKAPQAKHTRGHTRRAQAHRPTCRLTLGLSLGACPVGLPFRPSASCLLTMTSLHRMMNMLAHSAWGPGINGSSLPDRGRSLGASGSGRPAPLASPFTCSGGSSAVTGSALVGCWSIHCWIRVTSLDGCNTEERTGRCEGGGGLATIVCGVRYDHMEMPPTECCVGCRGAHATDVLEERMGGRGGLGTKILCTKNDPTIFSKRQNSVLSHDSHFGPWTAKKRMAETRTAVRV